MKLQNYKQEVVAELTQNILPFWSKCMVDTQKGGFYGRMSGEGELDKDSPKGSVLNARILWTFSAAYRLLRDSQYLHNATLAKNYLIDHFFDKEFGGVYWTLNADGSPLSTKKQIYALGFAIYGLSEYYRATNDNYALEYAIQLYNSIEEHSLDTIEGGYWEAFTQQWKEISDMRLSDKDANERKTMNTHLHILEPYTNLYRVWPNDILKDRIQQLVYIFTDKIYRSDIGHLGLFFSDDWQLRSDMRSYGHDIEATWLLWEAVEVINDEVGKEKLKPIIKKIAQKCAEEALQADGSMIYEYDPSIGHADNDKHWWVQAETVIGYFNLYQIFGNIDDFYRSINAWNFIKNNLIDSVNGEWYWSVLENGSVNMKDDKAGLWKCPYHNSRMCMEIMTRIDN